MDDDDIVLFITPSLVAILLHAEREKGSPLIEAEVLRLRDEAPCIAVPRDILPKMIESRGYEDIDPERCWEEWQVVRMEHLEED